MSEEVRSSVSVAHGVRVLDPRVLNRATLDRQSLLRRSSMDVLSAVEHLVGLQAQAPFSPYYQLWSRLREFDPEVLGGELTRRRVVRTVAMRGTVHLVTADDGLGLRPVIQSVVDHDLRTNTRHGKSFRRLDTVALRSAAREVLSGQALTSKEMGEELGESFPGFDPAGLAYAARGLLPLVQVPPRAVWGRSGQARLQTIESWLGRTHAPALDIDTLFLRYLRAFGPASVADAQTWCGLSKLSEVADRLRPRLSVYRDEAGLELFDFPDTPLPDPDTPAPVRFLPDFDNMIRSHADRSRFLTPADMKILNTRNGVTPNSVLVDGRVAATWRIEKTHQRAQLTIRPFRPLCDDARQDALEEGVRMLAFAHPAVEKHEIDILPPRA